MQKSLLFILFFGLSSIDAFGQIADTIKGDLYFGLWRYGSFYKLPHGKAKDFEKFVAEHRGDTNNTSEQEIIHIYDVIKKEDLLYHPYIQLKIENDSIVRLYLEKKDYKQIKKYKLQELQNNGEKITIVLHHRILDNGLIYCEKLISVSKVKGQTLEILKKFAIEDYP